MLFFAFTLAVIMGVAGLVVAFVAFPHRGQQLPGVPWLGETLSRAVGSLPTIADGELDPVPDGELDRGADRDRETLVRL
ncbi:hypothetical protein [Nocardioides coralli]|uniref:hypothetical protein n=1 Tax=Nocardioides coralli TaxID=2872154 RepID=UPI001CA3DEFD|nr:hypothetical protein [Nocardioides coralli]QZY28144.1 hypothetical protein K6T13_11680 [Nocardioides coralli]